MSPFFIRIAGLRAILKKIKLHIKEKREAHFLSLAPHLEAPENCPTCRNEQRHEPHADMYITTHHTYMAVKQTESCLTHKDIARVVRIIHTHGAFTVALLLTGNF